MIIIIIINYWYAIKDNAVFWKCVDVSIYEMEG